MVSVSAAQQESMSGSVISSVASIECDPLPLGWGLGESPPAPEVDMQACCDWLGLHRIWGQLPEPALQAIAQAFHLLKFNPDTLIFQEGQQPIGVYLLKWGSVEIYRQSAIGKTHIHYRNSGDLFGYLPLLGDPAQARYQTSAIALSAGELWILPQIALHHLLKTYPEIQQVINALLAQEVSDFTARIIWEEHRIQGLQSYIQPIPRGETILGSSKAAHKLTEQMTLAAADLRPVIFQAQPGSGKTFLAGLIHAQSPLASQSFAEMDCARLPRLEDGRLDTTPLFGRDGEQAGVIQLLERGTLLIDNVQILSAGDRDRLMHYLNTGIVTANPRRDLSRHLTSETPPLNQSWVRLVLASPNKLELPGINAHAIRLFPLSQRKVDIPEFARYFLDRFSQEKGRPPLQLDQADSRRLLSYQYPGNVAELAGILQRSVIMTPPGQSVISEQVLWSVQSDNNAFRIDLLDHLPWLRRLLLHPWYPGAIWIVMMVIFVPVVILGFIAPQTRDSSLTLNLFWAWWWPLYLFLFAFIGRLWCAVCPFMITAEWLRWISLWVFPRQQLTWNTRWLNRWGAWVLFAGFVAIYLWEHLWDLPHHAYLSAWLLIAITAGAVFFSLIYERRLWCRYLCPIGGMNGMFAKLAMVELRSTRQVCGSQCSTFNCYKGGPATPVTFANPLPMEGQDSAGCPLYSHPAQLQDNRDCVLCMDCLKACPSRSVQLNLRFPASDLLDDHRGFWAEAALLLLLFGGVFMHHSDRLLQWVGLPNLPLDADHLLIALPVVLLFLSIPAGLIGITHAIARLLDPAQPDLLKMIYAYLPFTLAANLTHYIPSVMTEAGQILPVFARTLGWSDASLPILIWSPDVAAFLQGVTLLSALLFSPYPLLRISQRPWISNLPHLALMLGLTLVFFNLML